MRGIGWLTIVRDGAPWELLNDLRFLKNADAAGGILTRNMADSDLCSVYNYFFSGCGSVGGSPAANSIWNVTSNDTDPGTGFYLGSLSVEGSFIANNDTALDVSAALEAIPGWAGNVSVTGGPLPATVTIEFIGALAGTDVQMTEGLFNAAVGTPPTLSHIQVGSPAVAAGAFDLITWSSNPWSNGGGADAEFLGFYVENWEGLEGDYDRTANARAWGFGGSNFTPLRANHLAMTFTVILGATTERGLQFGFRWLTTQLKGFDACDRADLIVFDHCPPVGVAPADWVWWTIHDAGVLDVPRWGDVILDSKNCQLRRVTFVLGARDPHKYRCPVVCTEDTAFVIPNPDTACAPAYSWSEWFCNDAIPPISCTVNSPSFDYSAKAAIVHIVGGNDGAPPMEISWSPTGASFRTTSLPAGGELTIDSSRHEIRFQPNIGDSVDGSVYVSAAFGASPVWAEINVLEGGSGVVAVRPLRICGLDGTSVAIETVDRV